MLTGCIRTAQESELGLILVFELIETIIFVIFLSNQLGHYYV